jgi:hypothetical protein
LILLLFLSSLCCLLRARRACPPRFRKGSRPRASHDRDTTPLHRTFGEANLEALRMRVTHVTRRKRQTRGKAQGVLRAPLPHSPPSQIVARPRATIPDNTQQHPQRHDNTLALSLGQTRRPCSPWHPSITSAEPCGVIMLLNSSFSATCWRRGG